MRSRIADLRRHVDHEMLLLLSDRSGAGSLGADDVISWGSPATLADRLMGLLRQQLKEYQDLFQIGDLTVDVTQRSVRRNGMTVLLSQREFQLLILLISSAGDPISRSAIIERLWDGDLNISDNAVDALASRLRRRLDGPFAARMLHTVRGVGYCLAVPERLQLAC
jgi:two-component system copper resistance phosphate regulon response regulator CusR